MIENVSDQFMSLVKPPSFKELVEAYGSPKKALLHLIEAGFSPEQIEWKEGIPYFRIRLLTQGIELKEGTSFSEMVNLYDRLSLIRGKKGKETELAKFFRNPKLTLEVKARFTLSMLTDENLKIGPGLTERSISLATGASMKEVKRLLIDYGEHGEVAYLLKKPKDPELTLQEVYEAVKLLPRLDKVRERELHVSSLLRVSTPSEAKYIIRLLLGDLKLGYQTRTVIRAAARAYEVPPELIENACAIIGLTEGITLASKGIPVLSEVKIRPGRFIKPQLAHLYENDKVAYPARAEYKLDGSRLQIHKWGAKAWLFSRRGLEKSQTLPEIVEIAQTLSAQSCIIDSEIIAVDDSGSPLPFQSLLSRTTPTKLSPEELEERSRRVKVTVKAFDILFLNGQEVLSLPLSERRRYLIEVVPPEHIVEGIDCQNEIELLHFYEEAMNKRHEGILVKDLNAPYEAGRRTNTWLKLKPERDTIDCVIVKALYGKGRRAGLYSSFLLAVRHPTAKKLYTIGKVSNLPVETMDSLRTIVERTGRSNDEEGVFVKPSLVVEATYQEIQETHEYGSGYALRVPKIVRFRNDKTIDQIDTFEKLKKLHELQYERHPAQAV